MDTNEIFREMTSSSELHELGEEITPEALAEILTYELPMHDEVHNSDTNIPASSRIYRLSENGHLPDVEVEISYSTIFEDEDEPKICMTGSFYFFTVKRKEYEEGFPDLVKGRDTYKALLNVDDKTFTVVEEQSFRVKDSGDVDYKSYFIDDEWENNDPETDLRIADVHDLVKRIIDL